MEERYIEVGMTALRDPITGDFGEPMPLYVRATERSEASEQRMINGIGIVLADFMWRYVNGCKEAGIII